ncbi:MAG: adenylate/guanylate cyclase domain-containing protein [Actinomycetota bacterium]
MGSTFGYARAADAAYIGYRIDGDGPVDIVQQPDWPGNIDLDWDDPWSASWLRGVAAMGRLITHDHRGVGLSSRDMGIPALETRVADLQCVLDAAHAELPVMIGFLSTGAVNAMACAMLPELARALVWMEPMARFAWAPDYPWGRRWEELDEELAQIASWGTDEYGRWMLQNEAATGNTMPGSMARSFTKMSRNACTPDTARALSKMWYETDVRGILPSVRTPTLLLIHEERTDQVEQARYIADLMPAAEVRIMPGAAWTIEEQPAWLDAIRRFVGEDLPAAPHDTILATVMFTDIVDSTAIQAREGDRAWKELIERHHAMVRGLLDRHGGIEQDTAGDGFYVRFDGPARAIRCAREIGEAVRQLGLEIRAGVHTGECEIADGKCSGISVTIGARVMAHAGTSEVMVSQTVKDLVAGSGLTFEDAGEHELKGVPDRWRLYRVVNA